MNSLNHFRSLVFLFTIVLSLKASAQSNTQYFNPVINRDCPDPTVVYSPDDGYYYALATGRTVQRYRSADLVNWTKISDAFTEAGRPKINDGSVWAPDINYIDGRYVMYYSQSVWGGEWTCGIGVATADDMRRGFFTDQGKLFTSEEIGVQNSIDPFYYEEEDGSKWLFWGSFRGIFAIELSEDGLALKEGAEKKRIAGGLTEGTYVYKHGDYYYLFGSAGSCCEGLNSTYRLVVARSKKLLGPYVNKEGVQAVSNGFTEILHKSRHLDRDGAVVGPGHCSEIIEDAEGKTWIFYHGYKAQEQNLGRCMFLDEVKWDSDGWPYITGAEPSVSWDKPVLTENAFTYSDVDYIDFRGEDLNYLFFFDTGYVPKSSTRVELECYSYPQNDLDEPFVGSKWRAIFSGRDNMNNGMSLYVNPEGDQFGFYMGGYVNNGIAPHEFEKKYTISTKLATVNINDEEIKTNRSNFTAGRQRITFFSGTDDYPYFGRIYKFSVYTGSRLVHEYIPKLRNEDGMLVFYDTVDDEYLRPSNDAGFSYGEIIESSIKEINSPRHSNTLYDLQGRPVYNPSFKGLYIQNGRKIIL